jgi:hypothetical protein
MARKLEGNLEKKSGGGKVNISGICEWNRSICVLTTVLALFGI